MNEILRVLVVDDEPGMLTGVQRALRDFTVHVADVGVEVRFAIDTASSGEDALQIIARQRPQVLLLDHKLPGLSGLEVLAQLPDSDGDMLTIMITAYASLETAVTATKRGAYDFLAKPFTPAELKDVLRKAATRVVLARQARKLAQEKRQVRFQFISVLAHELKAPLAAIEGYLSIVRSRTAGDDQAAYDHMLDRCMVRMGGMRKLIMDLLDLTRIESGQKRRELADVDLREVVQAAMEGVAPDAAGRSVTVELACDGPAVLTADRGEIEIICNNLLSNAVKYNRDGGKVTVTLGGDEEKVVLSVADTGIGMTPREAGSLFADFVRIRNDKTRKILGSGLGLSIVRKLAALYGGEATVTSRPDVGSTFTVTLRRDAQPREPHA